MLKKITVKNDIYLRLLLIVPAVALLGFTGCSTDDGTVRHHQADGHFAGTTGTHPAFNLQGALVGGAQTGDNVTIGPRTYNSESREFERPWPFGPVSGAQ
jgi:hypothetical protein